MSQHSCGRVQASQVRMSRLTFGQNTVKLLQQQSESVGQQFCSILSQPFALAILKDLPALNEPNTVADKEACIMGAAAKCTWQHIGQKPSAGPVLNGTCMRPGWKPCWRVRAHITTEGPSKHEGWSSAARLYGGKAHDQGGYIVLHPSLRVWEASPNLKAMRMPKYCRFL